jgi:deoxyribodipyrimidine photo-lyase|tara:strand:+ start:1976 stop:3118 length:1143 start_codon:yes stop_codon:yes gene_type:complete
MNFKPSRTFAEELMNEFIENNLVNYSKLRNFDYGPDKRSNVSCLSPYVTHGVISEVELIKKSLNKYSFVKNEKFIQEIMWRTFWKGWMELRPDVWADYLLELNQIKDKYKNDQDYKKAVEGSTEIQCFNEWVGELKENNYLHNHARMWFASIWIFTLELPWQLGAEFFMQHLYDGDPASNTLGWRWVAGIQTQGKNYLASEWNIKKFTDNRFKNIKLKENASPKKVEKFYPIIKKDFINPDIEEGKNLLVFENSLSLELSELINNKFNKIKLITNQNQNRKIKLSEKTMNFKTQLFEDQKKRLKDKSLECEILDVSEIEDIADSYLLYPTVGETLDYIESKKFSEVKFLYRKLDQFSWQYCNKGFFNFKNYIPKIIQKFN